MLMVLLGPPIDYCVKEIKTVFCSLIFKQALYFTLLCIPEVLPNTYSQFQNSQEFALGGGVIFDTLANSNGSHSDGVFISAL